MGLGSHFYLELERWFHGLLRALELRPCSPWQCLCPRCGGSRGRSSAPAARTLPGPCPSSKPCLWRVRDCLAILAPPGTGLERL